MLRLGDYVTEDLNEELVAEAVRSNFFDSVAFLVILRTTPPHIVRIVLVIADHFKMTRLLPVDFPKLLGFTDSTFQRLLTGQGKALGYRFRI